MEGDRLVVVRNGREENGRGWIVLRVFIEKTGRLQGMAGDGRGWQGFIFSLTYKSAHSLVNTTLLA